MPGAKRMQTYSGFVMPFLVFLVCIAHSYVDSEQPTAPRFEDYPATDAFRGRPASPQLIGPGDRAFQTRIRQAAAKGPNFAGHFTIAQWGCGMACVGMRVIDAQLGTVYPPPFGSLPWMSNLAKYEGRYVADDEAFKPLDYRLSSRLLVIRGCPDDKKCASYFYEWMGDRFRLLREITAVPVPDRR